MQEIVGKPLSFKRKPPARTAKQKKKPRLGSNPAKSVALPIDAEGDEPGPHKGSINATEDVAVKEAPPGCVLCPVCGKVVRESDAFNQHLGEYLSHI